MNLYLYFKTCCPSLILLYSFSFVDDGWLEGRLLISHQFIHGSSVMTEHHHVGCLVNKVDSG